MRALSGPGSGTRRRPRNGPAGGTAPGFASASGLRRVIVPGFVLAALAAVPASADPASARRDLALDDRSAAALERFERSVPARYFDEAWGYAVLPAVKRFGLGVGAAWGRGRIVEHGEVVGEVRFWQVTSGIQAGVSAVSLIVFFRDRDAMADLECGRIEFMGQAGLAVGGLGLLKTPGYDPKVAVFAAHRFGLMSEASVSLGRLSFRPYARREAPAC